MEWLLLKKIIFLNQQLQTQDVFLLLAKINRIGSCSGRTGSFR